MKQLVEVHCPFCEWKALASGHQAWRINQILRVAAAHLLQCRTQLKLRVN